MEQSKDQAAMTAAEHVLQRVKDRLAMLPKGRITNTDRWDAITIDMALEVVDQVIAEMTAEGLDR